MSRKAIAAALAFVLVAAILIYNSDAMKQARFVKELVARNIEARGGAEAWGAVASLRLTGQMDLGQGMVVPYMLEQKPGAYIFMGGGGDADAPMLHSPDYDFNDEALPFGASYWARLVERLLPAR